MLSILKYLQGFKLKLKNRVKQAKRTSIIITLALIGIIILFLSLFTNSRILKVSAQDLMKEIKAQKVETTPLSKEFIQATADFSLELFKQAYTKGENSLVSPTSVYLALGMTANGADGNTLKEFQSLLGKSTLNLKDLNTYYNSVSKGLSNVNSGKLSLANSIWYGEDRNIQVKDAFLQINADYYHAAVYKASFNQPQTVTDINNWVKFKTNNTIDKIIDKIDQNTIMYLIDAVYFQDKWKTAYKNSDVRKDNFQLVTGATLPADFMYSKEEGYLTDGSAQGFIKPYKNGKYSFVALLPNEGIDIDSYISSLSGEDFIQILKNKSSDSVTAGIRKFKSEYSVHLIAPLIKMGLKECFDKSKADFTKMAICSPGDIYVGDVLHKTFIAVDTEGTKAGAIINFDMGAKSVSISPDRTVILNRPFIYAIIDNETNLPLFIGSIIKPE
ncbi:MAG TPA: serpin family protein [Clostridiaceae bacterium]